MAASVVQTSSILRTTGSGSSSTLSRTTAVDTGVISGTTTILGIISKTETPDGRNISGTILILGSLSRIASNDLITASGFTGIPAVSSKVGKQINNCGEKQPIKIKEVYGYFIRRVGGFEPNLRGSYVFTKRCSC